MLCAGLLALAGADAACAWRSTGHLIVAQIAHDELSPEARREADRLSAVLADHEPRVRGFLGGSTWLDSIRRVGVGAFDRWHYINLPYNQGGLQAVADAEDDNLVVALEHQLEILSEPAAGDRWRALALRVVVHLVADAHQPLHCVERFTPELPHGDRGGNDFPIVPVHDADSLHALWDAMLGLYPQVPLSEVDTEHAAALAAAWAREIAPAAASEQPPVLDPHAWVRESHRLAVDVVYAGIEPGGAPSPEYIEAGRAVVARRLAQAGHRLAAVLESSLLVTPSE